MSAVNDITGKRFGRLTVIERAGSDSDGRATWLAECICGNKCIVRGKNLRTGNTTSCGCYSRELTRAMTQTPENREKHSGSNNAMYGKKSPHGKGSYIDGEWMRSSYEIAVAKLFIKIHYPFQYEPEAFPITYEFEGKLKQGTYRPDFYLPAKDMYIEVKGYWRGDAKVKFEAFKSQYPDLHIKLLDESRLKAMGFLQ